MKHFIQILALILMSFAFVGLMVGIIYQALYFLSEDKSFFESVFVKFLTSNIFNFIYTIFLGYLVVETDND